MILANLTALIAATAIKTKLSQTGERKTNRKNWGSLCGSAVLWHPRRRNTLPDCNMIFTEAAMTDNDFKSAAESALAVMERHLHALNGLRGKRPCRYASFSTFQVGRHKARLLAVCRDLFVRFQGKSR